MGLKLILFKLYLLLLALWMGTLAYHAFGGSDSWYEDPVTYIDHIVNYPVPGFNDPMPAFTIILSVVTVLSLLFLFTYHGTGRRTAFFSYLLMIFILLATYVYFTPVYEKLFDESGAFNIQVIEMSRTWIILNYIRLFFTACAFLLGLMALSKFRIVKQHVGKSASRIIVER